MAMTPFEVHQPINMDQALDLLTNHRTSVRVLAGGTDLVPQLKAGRLGVKHLVSLNRVPGLKVVSYAHGDGLVIGAGARVSDVAEDPEVRENYPALAHACSVMATPQVRHLATVAGNLANAAPNADTAAPLLAHEANVVLVERGSRRQVKLHEFFTGPGATVMEPMEMIEAIRVPAPPMRSGSSYQRLTARGKVDACAVGVAAHLNLDMDGVILGARLALSAVAPTPVRCFDAEEMLLGQRPEQKLLKMAGAACVRSSRPEDDAGASANYRRLMVMTLAQRAILEAAAMAKGGVK